MVFVFYGWRLLVLMLLWMTVAGFDAFMDDGCWFWYFSELGLLVLDVLMLKMYTIFDQNGPLGRRDTNMLKVSVLDKRSWVNFDSLHFKIFGVSWVALILQLVSMLLWTTVSGFDAFMDDGCWFWRFYGWRCLVLTLLWMTVTGFDASMDGGVWFWRFYGWRLLVLALLWMTVAGFDTLMDDGCWFYCFHVSELLVLIFFWIRVAGPRCLIAENVYNFRSEWATWPPIRKYAQSKRFG